ncbi:MAG: prolipoprotein diacylglyceryl transferase [Bacteroidota bacterium]
MNNLLYIYWNVSPTIFQLGPLKAKYYGFFFSSVFVVAYVVMRAIFLKEKIPLQHLTRLMVYSIIGVVVGTRLAHVCFYEPAYYYAHPVEIFMFWKGGLASHGGIIGIIIAAWIFSAKSPPKASFLWTMDRVMIPVAFASVLVRLGNLFNSEIVGRPTDVPWAFVFPRVDMLPRHPTQLYEALFYLIIGLILLVWYYKTDARIYKGLFFGIALVSVTIFRILIEFFKENQVVFEDKMILNMGQWLSVPFLIAGVYFVIRALTRKEL